MQRLSHRQREQMDRSVLGAMTTLIGAVSGGAAGHTVVCIIEGQVPPTAGVFHLVVMMLGVLAGVCAVLGARSWAS